jgi:hypothetical protein
VFVSILLVTYHSNKLDCFTLYVLVLDPVGKMAYFKKHWPEALQNEVLSCAEKVVRHMISFCVTICASLSDNTVV